MKDIKELSNELQNEKLTCSVSFSDGFSPEIYKDWDDKSIKITMQRKQWAEVLKQTNYDTYLTFENSPRYIGTDFKWMLYSYLREFETRHDVDTVTFLCGKFVYSKIKNLQGFSLVQNQLYAWLELNGEIIKVYRVTDKTIDPRKMEMATGYIEYIDSDKLLMDLVHNKTHVELYYFV